VLQEMDHGYEFDTNALDGSQKRVPQERGQAKIEVAVAESSRPREEGTKWLACQSGDCKFRRLR